MFWRVTKMTASRPPSCLPACPAKWQYHIATGCAITQAQHTIMQVSKVVQVAHGTTMASRAPLLIPAAAQATGDQLRLADPPGLAGQLLPGASLAAAHACRDMVPGKQVPVTHRPPAGCRVHVVCSAARSLGIGPCLCFSAVDMHVCCNCLILVA
jgi:hypothetical protein